MSRNECPIRAVRPVPRATAWRGVARCVVATVGMLRRGEISWPRTYVDRRIRFGDGTTGRVYRETAVDRMPTHPCVLVVSFRLRAVRGRGHAWFRRESLLNTPLFVGFPGFVSKLWLAARRARSLPRDLPVGRTGGAEHYVRSLWRVLELVSDPGSIDYRVLPGLRRDDVLADPPWSMGRHPRRPPPGGDRSRWHDARPGHTGRGRRPDRTHHRPAGARPRGERTDRRTQGGALPALAGDDRASAGPRDAAPAGRDRRPARPR